MSGPSPAEGPSGRAFWICLVAGWALIAFGLVTVFARPQATEPPNFAAWFLGLVVVHDGLVAPLALAVGIAVGRRVTGWARAEVCAALVLTAVLVLFSWTQLRGYGLQEDNPSLMPNDYAAGLSLVVLAIWAVTAVLLLRARARVPRRRTTRSRPPARP